MRALVADATASPPCPWPRCPTRHPAPAAPPRHGGGLGQPGRGPAAGKQPPGTVIGWDVAGTVAALGEGVTTFDVGERVLALSRAAAASPSGWSSRPSGPRRCRPPAIRDRGHPARGRGDRGRHPPPGQDPRRRPGPGHRGRRRRRPFTVQLALQANATVTGQAGGEERRRRPRHRRRGAGPPGDGSPVDGEFDVVLDGIGGPMVGPLLDATARNGRVVIYGNSADAPRPSGSRPSTRASPSSASGCSPASPPPRLSRTWRRWPTRPPPAPSRSPSRRPPPRRRPPDPGPLRPQGHRQGRHHPLDHDQRHSPGARDSFRSAVTSGHRRIRARTT